MTLNLNLFIVSCIACITPYKNFIPYLSCKKVTKGQSQKKIILAWPEHLGTEKLIGRHFLYSARLHNLFTEIGLFRYWLLWLPFLPVFHGNEVILDYNDNCCHHLTIPCLWSADGLTCLDVGQDMCL